MKMRLLAASTVAALTIVATGCTASGPLHNLDIVTLANGTQAYRVQCQGLLETSKTCMAWVNKICADKQPLRVSSTDRAASGFTAENDPREIIFICSAPPPPMVETPPPSTAVEPVLTPRTITLNADTNFAFDKADLTDAGRSELDRLVATSEGATIGTVAIDGHTDSVGSKSYNDKLSLRRARAVQGYLQQHGLRVQNYEVHGFGYSRPAASNATAEGRAKNRRVEISTSNITLTPR